MGNLRLLKRVEMGQRGCAVCADVELVKVKQGRENAKHCPHKKCPYTELNGYKDYKDYLKDTEDRWAFLKMLGKKCL